MTIIMNWDDEQEVLSSIKYHPSYFENVSKRLQNAREFILQAVKINGYVLGYVPEQLQYDREIVLTAVSCAGCALQYISTELRDDREIVLSAVKNNGFAFEFASVRLQNDREIVLAAVNQNYVNGNSNYSRGYVLPFLPFIFRADREVVLAAVETADVLKFVPKSFRDDKEIVLKSVKIDGLDIDYASKKLQNDPEVVFEAIREYYSGNSLDFLKGIDDSILPECCKKCCEDPMFMRNLTKLNIVKPFHTNILYLKLIKNQAFVNVRLPNTIVNDVMYLVMAS